MKKLLNLKILLLAGLTIAFIQSCIKEPPVEVGDPEIGFSMDEYRIKVGKQDTLRASVTNAIDAFYSWKLDGNIVSTDTFYLFNAERIGEYFLTFRVDAENGSAEDQVKVTVSDKLEPEITINTVIATYVGTDTEISPESVLNSDDASYKWKSDGELVGEESTYVFNRDKVGIYHLTLKVENEDGADMVAITINVLPSPEPEIFFDNGRYRIESNKDEIRRFSVCYGKSLVMAPVLCNISDNASFQWSVDGTVQSATGECFTFTPSAKGTYEVTVKVTDGESIVSTTANVECVDEEGTYYRAKDENSTSIINYVYDFVPAPGQFINYQEGTTKESVLNNLNAIPAVAMIGAYGGYYIVGFDHSVDNSEGADLKITGNAFAGWSEPGIVWVMQDENGDGLPNDTWYELKGSESGKEETKLRYAITYYKPGEPKQNVLWTDNLGRISSVDYNSYHSQDYYFPMFIEEDSYTLCGTCLASTMQVDEIESSPGYDWGYVDNYGDGVTDNSLFFIENAIQADGSEIDLQYIDFVKVHTAMIGKGSAVGEISCEAGTPYDYHLY